MPAARPHRHRAPRARPGVVGAALLLAGCLGGAAPDAAPPTPDATPGAASTSPAARASDTATQPPTPTVESPATPEVVVHGASPPPLHPSVDGYPAGTVELVAGDGTVHRVPVRVADTDERRGHGLMEVPDVPAGTGMAFTYDEDRDGPYTMRGTLTPLQIAWVDADGVVVSMADMVPCEAEPCPSWPADATYRTALEVRAGWLDTIGVGIGDEVTVLP